MNGHRQRLIPVSPARHAGRATPATTRWLVLVLITAGVSCPGCGKSDKPPKPRAASDKVHPADSAKPARHTPAGMPERVHYDQIFVSFRGVPAEKQWSGRTREEAKRLAEKLHERVKLGFDFETLKQKFSDDRLNGKVVPFYVGVNDGLPYQIQRNEIPRERMAKDFGNQIFALKVGEIAMVPYDKKDAPYGWHIVRRLK